MVRPGQTHGDRKHTHFKNTDHESNFSHSAETLALGCLITNSKRSQTITLYAWKTRTTFNVYVEKIGEFQTYCKHFYFIPSCQSTWFFLIFVSGSCGDKASSCDPVSSYTTSAALWSERIYVDNQPIHYCTDTGVGMSLCWFQLSYLQSKHEYNSGVQEDRFFSLPGLPDCIYYLSTDCMHLLEKQHGKKFIFSGSNRMNIILRQDNSSHLTISGYKHSQCPTAKHNS